MKNLIVYYSHSGNNEKLAYEIKERLQGVIFQICEHKKRKTISIMLDYLLKRNSRLTNSTIDISEYDNIVFIAPIWGGKIATPMRVFIEKIRNNLNNYYFITLCNGVDGQEEKLLNELNLIAQRKPQAMKQLSINILLPKEHQNKIKHTFNFRITEEDLQQFNNILDDFVKILS